MTQKLQLTFRSYITVRQTHVSIGAGSARLVRSAGGRVKEYRPRRA